MTKEEIDKQQSETLSKAKEAQDKIAARVEELKTYEGKTFARKDGIGKATFKVIRYEGIGKLLNGDLAHLFRVESKNPNSIWTPPATQFLLDHEEIEVKENETIQKEVI